MTEGTKFTLFAERVETPSGANSTQIDLMFHPDGSLRLDGVYSGPEAEAFWGDWDHEFWMDIPAHDAKRFLALIARAAFTRDKRLTYADLTELCKSAEISFEEGHWT